MHNGNSVLQFAQTDRKEFFLFSVAQDVERSSRNPEVGGSILTKLLLPVKLAPCMLL